MGYNRQKRVLMGNKGLMVNETMHKLCITLPRVIKRRILTKKRVLMGNKNGWVIMGNFEFPPYITQ